MTNQVTHRRGTFDSQAGTLAVAAAAATDHRISEPERIVGPRIDSLPCRPPAPKRRLGRTDRPVHEFLVNPDPTLGQGPTPDKQTRCGAWTKMRAFPLALIAIATVAAAACGSSESKRATQATQTRATATQVATTTRPALPPQKFISHRYRFAVTLTNTWLEHDALVDWNGKKLQGLESAAFANFTDPATGRTLAVADARAATGMGLAEWRAAMVRAAPPACSDSSSAEKTTLGGEPALTWTATCSDGYDVDKLATLHRTRGYMVLLASPTANNKAQDGRIFESIRRSFRFTR